MLGHEPVIIRSVCADMLSQNFNDDRTLVPFWFLFHQLTYWKVLELEDIAVLAIVRELLDDLISVPK